MLWADNDSIIYVFAFLVQQLTLLRSQASQAEVMVPPLSLMHPINNNNNSTNNTNIANGSDINNSYFQPTSFLPTFPNDEPKFRRNV